MTTFVFLLPHPQFQSHPQSCSGDGLAPQLRCERHTLPADPLRTQPGLLLFCLHGNGPTQHLLPAVPHLVPCTASRGGQTGLGGSGGRLDQPDTEMVSGRQAFAYWQRLPDKFICGDEK